MTVLWMRLPTCHTQLASSYRGEETDCSRSRRGAISFQAVFGALSKGTTGGIRPSIQRLNRGSVESSISLICNPCSGITTNPEKSLNSRDLHAHSVRSSSFMSVKAQLKSIIKVCNPRCLALCGDVMDMLVCATLRL